MSFLAELDQLHREALDLARRFAATRPGATGTDPTGTVQVGVTGDGEVEGVAIDPAWRGRFGPDGLGDALSAAAGDALRQQVRQWAGHLDPGDPAAPAGPAGPTDTASSVGAERAGWPEPALEPVDPDALDHLHYLVAEAIGRLPELDRTGEPATVWGSSTDRRVRVMVVGGQVAGVEFDRRWLASAAVTAITDHARQALRAAFAGAAADGSGPDRRAIDEVRALTADPAALLRRLGLG